MDFPMVCCALSVEMFVVSGPSSYYVFSYEKKTLLQKVVEVRPSGCAVRRGLRRTGWGDPAATGTCSSVRRARGDETAAVSWTCLAQEQALG